MKADGFTTDARFNAELERTLALAPHLFPKVRNLWESILIMKKFHKGVFPVCSEGTWVPVNMNKPKKKSKKQERR